MKNIVIGFFVLLCINSPLFFTQDINAQQHTLNNNFSSARLVKGVPVSLDKIKYFFAKDQIYYAVIYTTRKDSIYFIRKNTKTDSVEYSLLLTSYGILKDYKYLNFKQVEGNKLFASGSVKIPDDKTFNIMLYYLPDEQIVRYNIIQKNSFNGQLSSIAKFELGVSNRLIFMFKRAYNSSKNGLENSLEVNILDFQFSAGIRFLEHNKLEYRIGWDYLYEYFSGLNNGIFIQRDLFNTKVFGTPYIILGIDYFKNTNVGHGTVSSGGNFIFHCVGLGFRQTPNFSVELTYWIPNKKVYGSNLDNNYEHEYNKIDNGLLEFGFQYLFVH